MTKDDDHVKIDVIALPWWWVTLPPRPLTGGVRQTQLPPSVPPVPSLPPMSPSIPSFSPSHQLRSCDFHHEHLHWRAHLPQHYILFL